MSLAEEKSEVRKRMKHLLTTMTTREIAKRSKLATEHMCALPAYRAANVVLAFLSMGDEILTQDFIARALADGKTVAVPRMERSPEAGDYIVFVPLSSDYKAWPLDRFGIPTPARDAMALSDDTLGASRVFVSTPGLAFDRTGGRLGRGKGFYDRFLAGVRAKAAGQGGLVFACGFCLAEQVVEHVPCGENDTRVDAIITEVGTIIT